MFEPSFCQTCQKELTGAIEIVSRGTGSDAVSKDTTDPNWRRCGDCESIESTKCAADVHDCKEARCETAVLVAA